MDQLIVFDTCLVKTLAFLKLLNHYSRYRQAALYFYSWVKPDDPHNEADLRRNYLLQAIIISCLIFIGILFILFLGESIVHSDSYYRAPTALFLIILSFFVGLLYMARHSRGRLASYIFIVCYFFGVSYGTYVWGASMPIGLLNYALLVIMGGIIINSRFGMIIAFASFLNLLVSGLREELSGISPAWKQSSIGMEDILSYGAMLGLAAFFSWLSRREIEKSLSRALQSETALKAERDNLEKTVENRTQSWKNAEIARNIAMSRFAEFGKLSAGMFHDLISPLTAISLSLGELKSTSELTPGQIEAKTSIDRAITAACRIQEQIVRARKHISGTENLREFQPEHELRDICNILEYKARQAKTALILEAEPHITLLGNPLKFYQIGMNLVLNSIEAYMDQPDITKREITIKLKNQPAGVCLIVRDDAGGMDPEVLKNIFTPFYTSKSSGVGLGLSLVKDIIESHFYGTISCHCKNSGTLFELLIPKSSAAWKPLPYDSESNPSQTSTTIPNKRPSG